MYRVNSLAASHHRHTSSMWQCQQPTNGPLTGLLIGRCKSMSRLRKEVQSTTSPSPSLNQNLYWKDCQTNPPHSKLLQPAKQLPQRTISTLDCSNSCCTVILC